MAFFSQERKTEKMPALKALCNKYGVNASFSINNYSTFVATISSSRINFLEGYEYGAYRKVNEHNIANDFKGEAMSFLSELKDIMMEGNWNNSDPMTDYFDVGWYIDISIGRWNKDFVFAPSIKIKSGEKVAKKREPKPMIKVKEDQTERVMVQI